MDLSDARWRRSSRSGTSDQYGNCVEVAFDGVTAAMRDSKNVGGPVLVVPGAQWREMLGALDAPAV